MQVNEINLDKAYQALREVQRINRISIMDAVFTRNGKVVVVSEEDRKEYSDRQKQPGCVLGTISFIRFNYNDQLSHM